MTKTPEGFLICHNVPIACIGWYPYLGHESGLNDAYDQVIKGYRSPEEVFSSAAIISFEGKKEGVIKKCLKQIQKLSLKKLIQRLRRVRFCCPNL
ncbi:DUF2213 domain-containing protein [Clostridium sp. JN-1]|mgnify:CR=1 FL=1|jgi:hypothetical protein|uniref:DUF2213 domain-containing protein n=1 Tax=Clostridium sp. JN-1 TaxID=2483110 RepID=UPI000F0B6850|nr:DUF2213 domain-containing protein [Clostridium sp. JN-1]